MKLFYMEREDKVEDKGEVWENSQAKMVDVRDSRAEAASCSKELLTVFRKPPALPPHPQLTTSVFPLLEAVRFVDATFAMFLDELCVAYDLDSNRFRAFLIQRVQSARSSEVKQHFDPEEWIARYCIYEAAKLTGSMKADDDEFGRGWLFKKGRINRSWRRRYFWLDGCCLGYAEAPDCPPRGELQLCDACSVVEAFRPSDGSRRIDLGFVLHTPHRRFHIRARDAWCHKKWVAAIRCSINRAPKRILSDGDACVAEALPWNVVYPTSSDTNAKIATG